MEKQYSIQLEAVEEFALMSKINVLMLTPAFPPYGGSHTQRMTAIANTLSKNGIGVFVMTYDIMPSHPTYDEVLLKNVDKDIRMARIKCGYLHYRAYKNNNFTKIKYGSNSNNQKKSLKNRILSFFDKIKDSIFVPDSIIDWKHNVLHHCKKTNFLKTNKIDYIYACSMPCSMLSIGYKLSRKYNIPLLLDYGDPWVFNSNYRKKHTWLKFRIEHKLEKKYLKTSLLVTFSTKGCEKLYKDKYFLKENKTLTIMTGYEDRLFDLTKSYIFPKKEDDFIVLSYGGAIQTGVRDPIPLFHALEKFPKYRFNIRTDKVHTLSNMVNTYASNANINVIPYIKFDEYYFEMLSSDVLVFFGNSTPDQLPGKIFNYLPTGKPILYICNIDDDSKDQALEIVKDYGNYVFCHNNYDDICIALHDIKKKIQAHNIEESKIVKYSNYNQCSKLAQWLKQKEKSL